MKKNLALFMSILENDFSSEILRGSIKASCEMNASLTVFPMGLINATYVDVDANAHRYQYNILDAYMNCSCFDGIIVEYGTICSDSDERIRTSLLSKMGSVPTVLLCGMQDGYTCINVDNENGLRQLLEHLIVDHKYSKIGFLSGMKSSQDANSRKKVYIETMKAHGIYMGEDWIAYGNFSPYVDDVAEDLIKLHPDIEAIVCANDAMVIGVMNAMRKLGLEPGKDIAVTGFDDIILDILNQPEITTVKADPAEVGYEAVRKLCTNPDEIENIVIKSKALLRKSCGCLDYVAPESDKLLFGIMPNWQDTARYRYEEANTSRSLAYELSNVIREMVYAGNSEKERYNAILRTLQRLHFKKCQIYLYDKFIRHSREDEWINPELIYLVGSTCNESYDITTYNIGQKPVAIDRMFANPSDERVQRLVVPLFFGHNQMGLLVAESEQKAFLAAFDMANQISSTLYINYINDRHVKLQKALQDANEAKGRFLANMSHEIRTPINAIIGFNEMIIRESNDESILDYSNDVKNAADALLLLVNDVLDFSKIEAGKMELVEDDYSLKNLVNTIISMMTGRAEKKGLALFLEYDSDISPVLVGDSGRLQQILLNIISNAIKYTEKGTVTLKVCRETSDEPDLINIRFSVSDTGIGIRKEEISRLFNEFERIDEKRNRNVEGTGLGINITTGLLALMDSKLEVESEYGVGSTFSFSIRQKKSGKPVADFEPDNNEKKKKKRASEFIAPSVKVMVVDDNMLNRKVLSSLLRDTQMQIDQAESGRKCIEMVKATNYDIILLDHMMPDLDGIETLEILLKDNLVNIEQTPVVALTANAISGAREEYLAAGFTDYLAKPVRPNDLYAMLAKYIPADRIEYVKSDEM